MLYNGIEKLMIEKNKFILTLKTLFFPIRESVTEVILSLILIK